MNIINIRPQDTPMLDFLVGVVLSNSGWLPSSWSQLYTCT